MADNVLPLPGRVERLVRAIQSDLQRQTEGDREWIDASCDLCLHLAELRDQFAADIEFGHACEAHGFGKGVLNHQTRAAAISMGREPEALRACLEATKSRSLHVIYSREFGRFTNVCKPNRPRTKKPPTAKKENKAAEVYDRLVAEGREFTIPDLAQEAGVSYGTAQRAFFKRETEGKVIPPLDPETATPSVRARMEAWQRAERKRMRAEIELEVRELFEREFQERSAYVFERAAWAEKTLARYDGLMPKQDYQTIVKCLHPDTTADAGLRAEAFRLFTKHKDILIKPELKASGPPLPGTLSELLARRRGK
jgi:hypothetical protein